MISCYHLCIPHPYKDGALFDDASFDIPKGAWAEVLGQGSSGKSILFSILSLRQRATQATLILYGCNILRLRRGKLEELRRRIGSCAQYPVMLEERSVLENLLLPLLVRGSKKSARDEAMHVLDELNLCHLCDVKASALTTQERRLIGLARTTLSSPELILVDGGVEGLDMHFRKRGMQLLKRMHRQGCTVVLFAREATSSLGGIKLDLRLEGGQVRMCTRATHAPCPEILGVRR